jgi:hypothetical protein
MIDAAVANSVHYGDMISLRASGETLRIRDNGKFLSAENGGPTEDGKVFKLTARSRAGLWESWRVFRGSRRKKE